MDTTIITAIGSLGFPIVSCLAMGWYVKYIIDKLTNEHQQEMREVTTALNNNTLVIQKLCDKLEQKGVDLDGN